MEMMMKFPLLFLVPMFILPAGAATVALPPPQLLFDVNFSSPADTPGTSAKTGQPPNANGVYEHPSSQVFGSTQVLGSYGNLTSQPASLVPGPAGSYTYSQLRFDTQSFYSDSTTPFTRKIEFRFDLLLKDLAGGVSLPATNGSEDLFGILLDANSTHRIDFNGSNKIYFSAPAAGFIQIGSYLESVAQRYSVINYLDENRMEVWQDGNLLYSGKFHTSYPADPSNPTMIKSYRLNLGDSGLFATTPVAVIDNLSIRFVPECGAPVMLSLAAFAWLALDRKRERKTIQ